MTNFYKLIFSLTLIAGILITVSSYSPLSMWMGLEINLLSIIPLMKNQNSQFSSEASFKYFIVQSMASTAFLFSIILNFNLSEQMNSYYNNMINIIFYSSILTKMGAAPFHAWFPEVLEGLNWKMCLVLLTVQKLAPMIIILENFSLNLFMIIIIIISSFIGSILGLNQISLRKIMAYSSINHISWMLSSMMSTKMIWLVYFSVYFLISIMIISTFMYTKTYFLHQILMFNSNLTNLMFKLNFLSLGGLPPFLGFFPKWLVINFLVYSQNYLIALLLIVFTLISLYVYTRILFSTMTLFSSSFLQKELYSPNFILSILNMLTLSSLIYSPILFNYL